MLMLASLFCFESGLSFSYPKMAQVYKIRQLKSYTYSS